MWQVTWRSTQHVSTSWRRSPVKAKRRFRTLLSWHRRVWGRHTSLSAQCLPLRLLTKHANCKSTAPDSKPTAHQKYFESHKIVCPETLQLNIWTERSKIRVAGPWVNSEWHYQILPQNVFETELFVLESERQQLSLSNTASTVLTKSDILCPFYYYCDMYCEQCDFFCCWNKYGHEALQQLSWVWLLCCWCRHMPSHASREVLIVLGSLSTCDPGDIGETIKVWLAALLHCTSARALSSNQSSLLPDSSLSQCGVFWQEGHPAYVYIRCVNKNIADYFLAFMIKPQPNAAIFGTEI